MTLTALFDMVAKEVGANHFVSREGSWFLANCQKSGVAMLIRADSGPKWGKFTVTVLDSRQTRGQNPVRSGEVWSGEQVRDSLTAIQACEFVRVMLGRESIDTALDERWIIRDVTHQPILSSSDTLDTVLATLRDRYGLRTPADASPMIRESPRK